MNKLIQKIIPLYGILPLLCAFGLNMIVYSGAMSICAGWKHYDLTTSLDRMVPLVPWWMYIYFGCYLFWVVNYIMVARIHKDDPSKFYRFVTTDMMSRMRPFLFPYADDKCPAGGGGHYLCRRSAALSVPDRPAGQSIPIHSLPGELDVLYRHSWKQKSTQMVSGFFLYLRSAGGDLYPDHQTALYRRCRGGTTHRRDFVRPEQTHKCLPVCTAFF